MRSRPFVNTSRNGPRNPGAGCQENVLPGASQFEPIGSARSLPSRTVAARAARSGQVMGTPRTATAEKTAAAPGGEGSDARIARDTSTTLSYA